MTRYTNRHVSQYGPWSTVTRQSGCTWTSGSNGIDAQSGGKVTRTPDQVHALVPRGDETSPATPGWSLDDLHLAMLRMKPQIPFRVRSGSGWTALVEAHDKGHYLVVQGDSDVFSNSTCSGAFNGDHAIGVHPNENQYGHWRIDDPICGTARYELPSIIERYAEKFAPSTRWGEFVNPVPLLAPDTSTEDPMLLTNCAALTGTASLTVAWGLWDVATDVKSAPVAKGTKYDVLGSCTYHKSKKNPAGFTGYLVNHSGRLHVLPSKDVSTFAAKPGDPRPYVVELKVGGKPVSTGPLTLP